MCGLNIVFGHAEHHLHHLLGVFETVKLIFLAGEGDAARVPFGDIFRGSRKFVSHHIPNDPVVGCPAIGFFKPTPVNMGDNAIHGIDFFGCVKLVRDQRAVHPRPGHDAIGKNKCIFRKGHSVVLLQRVKLGLRCREIIVVLIKRRRPEIVAHLNDHVRITHDTGKRVAINFVADDHRHFRSKSPVFNRRHAATAGILVADLEGADIRRAVFAIERIADEPAQDRLINIGKAVAVAVGIFRVAHLCERRDDYRHIERVVLCPCHEFIKGQEWLLLTIAHALHDTACRVGDVKKFLCERPARISHMGDAEVLRNIVKCSVRTDQIRGGKEIRTEKSGCQLRAKSLNWPHNGQEILPLTNRANNKHASNAAIVDARSTMAKMCPK